jgi:hypothetical protein
LIDGCLFDEAHISTIRCPTLKVLDEFRGIDDRVCDRTDRQFPEGRQGVIFDLLQDAWVCITARLWHTMDIFDRLTRKAAQKNHLTTIRCE